MTVCNMTIEAGARAGMIAPDEKAYRLSRGPPHGAQGRGLGQGHGPTGIRLRTDEGRSLRPRGDARRRLPAAHRLVGHLAGGRGVESAGAVPNPDDIADEGKRQSKWRALEVHGPEARHRR